MSRKRVSDTDAFIGARIRSRRLDRNLSQTELAEPLGITFQQIQKYENGVNRVSGSRLIDIARLLKTTPAFLLGSGDAKEDELSKLTALPGAITMLKAFAKIQSPDIRARVIRLFEAMGQD